MNVKFTKTATFLFPLLEVPKKLFKCHIKDSFGRLMYDDRFLNAYLGNSSILHYNDENHIFIVVRNYRDIEFEEFYSNITQLPNHVDDYDKNDCLIFIFKVPEHRKNDFELIKQGYYSKISQEAKSLILVNNYFSGEVSTIPLILNKSEALRESWEKELSTKDDPIYLREDQDVWPVMKIEQQILTDKILNSYIKRKHLSPGEV